MKFTILSDHKPLKFILGHSQAIPTLSTPWVQRWALLLSSYNYSLAYKPGSKQANADALSRLPLPGTPKDKEEPDEVLLLRECLQVMNLQLSCETMALFMLPLRLIIR